MRLKITLTTLAVITMLAAVLAGMYASTSSKNTILPGVSIAGIDVGSMTPSQAETALAPTVKKMNAGEITLKCGKIEKKTTFSELGAKTDTEAALENAMAIGGSGTLLRRISDIISSIGDGTDIPLNYELDEKKTAEYLKKISQSLVRQPKDARPTAEKDKVTIQPEEAGTSPDVEGSIKKLSEAINSGESQFDIPFKSTEPKVTAADLEGINSVAVYTTKYKTSQRDRSHNLKIACDSINGTIIRPGKEFSYNKVVGPRQKKYGFRDAPMFVNGEVEPGTGGGVCQISSTVYNAALLANMKIVKRSHHSRPVVYAPVGRDATVAYPSVDLKFKNATDAPIYITASAEKGTVKVEIFHKKEPGVEVTIYRSGYSKISAPVVKITDEKLDSDEPVVVAEGRAGHRITIYRIIKTDGKETKRELISKDYYAPAKRIVKVPAPKPAKPETPNGKETKEEKKQPEGKPASKDNKPANITPSEKPKETEKTVPAQNN